MAELVRLPHTGRARMVVAAERVSPEEARCTAVVPSDHPHVRDGRAPSAVLMELGAQAAATLAEEGGAPGRVVAVKELRWEAPTVPSGTELRVDVSLLEVAPPLRNYAFEVPGHGRGVVSVWLG